jgi:hypothetical protein
VAKAVLAEVARRHQERRAAAAAEEGEAGEADSS